ncbi:MAG: ADP compounds hydrolase NudE [Methylobacter sp.]|uniref:ADP compounds hydrolase NudE n=1 Tax=Methylovulum miyakonense TaxID=645578 RepID=UPI00036406E6|nr:ADP compounds hydrolase NudE [Methylovulum miyakonense]PPD42172.1 MAG: ADP compounds hydrolase NudE [Methylobacter sp.]
MAQKPTILTKTLVAKSRLFRIEALDIQFSNGELRQYERLARSGMGGAVLVVPMLDSTTVLLIREYSAGTHRYELGLPKGKVDAGESFFEAANRELKEEVGFGANSLYHLSTFSVAPSYLEHTTEIILAQDLYAEKLDGDEPEELEVIAWKLADLNALMATGECTEARSIAALFMAREYLEQSAS